MILDIDVGNSRLKWRLSAMDGTTIRRDVCAGERDLAGLHWEMGSPERVRVASVRGAADSALIEICESRWGVSPEFASSQAYCANVTNAYENPESLGVDRWLAIMAAFNSCHSACCIVDAGSAATLDLVSKEGKHLGGYIVPGLSLQRRSLLESTGIRLPDSQWPPMLQPGTNTSLAVHGGILSMLVGWIRQASLPTNAGETRALYLTGGDAALLSVHLGESGVAHHLVPDLVLDGLAWALP